MEEEALSIDKIDVDTEEQIFSTTNNDCLQLNSIDSTFLQFSSTKRREECLPSFLRNRVRFLILLVTMLFLILTRANELSFNFTVICMTSNTTVNNDEPLFMTPRQVSVIFACIGIGALFSAVPVVFMLQTFGSRYLFSLLLLISSISTLLFSPLAKISPIFLSLLRLLQGMSLSTVMTIMGEVTATWSPVSEIGKFMTFLSAASQFSLILTMPLSAYLCLEFGWSSVYYLLGVVSGIVAILFFAFYRNTPDQHPWVSVEELNLITKGEKREKRTNRAVPYKDIFKSKAVWGVWIAFLGNSFGFQLIIQFMPIYMNKVILLPIAQTGVAAFIAPVSQLLTKIVAVSICDRIKCISETLKLRIFNSIAMCGCGLSFLPLGFLSPGSYILATLCFTSSISFLGIVTCGSLKSAPLIARQFTAFVMAVVQFVICIGALLMPFLVNALAADNTVAQWRLVFFSVCFVLLITNLAFCLMCSAEPEPWTLPKKWEYHVVEEKISMPS